MKYPHLLAQCFEPVAMTEEALRVCIAIVSGDEHFAEDRAAALAVKPLGEKRTIPKQGGVATICVSGPLVRKAGPISEISALTTYDSLRADLRACMADPSVKAVAWSIDSPGGDMSGLFELADEITAARAVKPMAAHVISACSAGYVLAAAVGNISTEQCGISGSVGAIVAVPNPDAAEAGKRIEFVSSVSPFKRVDAASKAGKAEYQARADQLGALLVEKVAAYRGVSAEQVAEKYGEGRVLIGAAAVQAGLADRIGTIDGVVAALASAAATYQQGAKMKTILGLSADADEATVTAAIKSLVDFKAQALATIGVDGASANGVLVAAMESHRALPGVRAELAKLDSESIKRDLRGALSTGLASNKLSLGAIQKTIPNCLRGEPKKAWIAAMGKLESVTSASVLEAACSVAVSREDLESIAGYVGETGAVAAAAHDEPPRDGTAEAAELDATAVLIKSAADAARKSLDRGSVAAPTAK